MVTWSLLLTLTTSHSASGQGRVSGPGLLHVVAYFVLFNSDCPNKTPWTLKLEQQTFNFSQFQELELPQSGPALLGFWWGFFSWIADDHFLVVSSQRRKDLLSLHPLKDTNSILGTPPPLTHNPITSQSSCLQ